jgi:hypothetical protein
MSNRFFLRTGSLCVCLLLLLGISTSYVTPSLISQAQAAAGGSRIYLPYVTNRFPAQNIFGVGMTVIPDVFAQDVASLGATWVRRDGPLWRDVEPEDGGGYHWDAPVVRLFEQEMLNAGAHNLKPVVIVHGSPAWATINGSDCAPIKAAYHRSFANFMAALVDRYSRPPYNVKHWEIGNEPDAPISPDSGWGCWGIPSDKQFFGGRAYGDMLKVVYPAIKAANPTAQVLNGGLLLGNLADPSANFIKGVFAAGAGDSFDILSYHAYSFYFDPATYGPDGTSGATDEKVGYLRGVMDQYRVPQKPLFNTEGALLCRISGDCKEQQADVVPRIYARAMKDDLIGLSWYIYDSDGFYRTALIEPGNFTIKRPAYLAYKQAARMFGDSTYVGALTGQPGGVEGYQFQRGANLVTVVWSNTPRTATIPVGGATSVSCFNRGGAQFGCSSAGSNVYLEATSSPSYVVAR